jgi:hypothetical protein
MITFMTFLVVEESCVIFFFNQQRHMCPNIECNIAVEFFSYVPNFEVIPIDYNYSEITHIEKMKKFAITTEIRLSIDTIYPYRVRSVLLTVI